jgi:hypothetical protein
LSFDIFTLDIDLVNGSATSLLPIGHWLLKIFLPETYWRYGSCDMVGQGGDVEMNKRDYMRLKQEGRL